MRFPQEVVVETFVPTVRYLLARSLSERGLSQEAVADHVGVSQSAVSKYVLGKADPHPDLVDHPRVRETVDRVAEGLAADEMTDVEALREFMALIRALETRGPICSIHEEQMPGLQGLGCDLCVRLEDSLVIEDQEILADVREAVRLLESEPRFADLVPHVGSNVALARPGAEELTDVAAVAGGLVDLQGEVRAPGEPDFGASRTVGQVALAAARVDPDRRAALNIRSADDVVGAAQAMGLDVLEVEAALERDREALVERLREEGRVPNLLFHRGAHGVEAIAYLLTGSASEAARTACSLAAEVEG
jgi:predicted fused transcriptional regulator/phosphomethylpyrimidine kinase/predicted transcriptional regulator